ncbi:uncharacterized protein LOC105258462 [Camponotus floridanus]|uniref:uncharacterized protein LOC105258462 n=1 Tax=Camponotus floridanus TaxID=104421 RepID=UPI00059CE62C|nr:uncharacterized protein LOC105258462 [Camponotus floridanus]
MKRIALLVLALATNAIADEDEMIQMEAVDFETGIQTIKDCLDGAETTIDELNLIRQKMLEIKEDEDIDEETKEYFLTYGRYIACILEKEDLIKDSKLVVDKIMKENEKDDTPLNKKDLEKCLNSLNEGDLNLEQRAFGLVLCFQNVKLASPNKR